MLWQWRLSTRCYLRRPGFAPRAKELNIDAQTRQRFEEIYQEKEPKYHEIKAIVEQRTKQLYSSLVTEVLEEELIAQRMKALLEAESQLKLYQVHVRISLLAQLTPKQRQAVRELARLKPEADWQGALLAKVERARHLSKRLKDSGELIADIEQRMKEIDENIANGKITKGSRLLDQVIRDLESQ